MRAHEGVLEDGDIEHGKPNDKVKDLILIEGLERSMGDVIDLVCEKLACTVQV